MIRILSPIQFGKTPRQSLSLLSHSARKAHTWCRALVRWKVIDDVSLRGLGMHVCRHSLTQKFCALSRDLRPPLNTKGRGTPTTLTASQVRVVVVNYLRAFQYCANPFNRRLMRHRPDNTRIITPSFIGVLCMNAPVCIRQTSQVRDLGFAQQCDRIGRRSGCTFDLQAAIPRSVIALFV